MGTYNGNSMQEPLAIFDAEYMWNSEASAFYTVTDKPKSYEEYLDLVGREDRESKADN